MASVTYWQQDNVIIIFTP